MQNFIKYISIFIFLLTFFNNSSFSQELSVSDGELEVKDNAYEYFENKNFQDALPLFSQLLSRYPKNPEYNYCYGICLIQLNKETEKAVKYLEFASTNDVNSDVYFFLAKAYHLNYLFDDAITYYKKFKEEGRRSQIKEYKPDRQINMCNNGKDLIRYISELTVLENKQIKDRDFYRSYEIADFGGVILNNPFEFKTKIDRREKDNSILFLSIERNVIYLSSYGKNKKNGKDIYCVTLLEDGTWSKPENLGKVINTTYDEAFPYIHPDGKTLYFSSKGHNSMGGYDIFRSTYDGTAQSWTEPVNLDFPTNSPYDDILFISDAQEDVAYFASNRETGQENISVYKILIDKNPVEKELHNLEEIALNSKLALSPLAEELAERIQSSKVSKPQVTPNFYNYNDSLQFFPVDSNQRIIADFYNYNKDISIKLYKKRNHTFAEVEHTDDLYDDDILVPTKSGSEGGSEQEKIDADEKQIAFQKENIDSSTVAEAKVDSSAVADAKAEKSQEFKDEYNIYYKILEENRAAANTQELKLAHSLEKEAELYYEKAEIIRKYAHSDYIGVEDFNERANELTKAKNFELIAIQKQKYAIDLYLKAKEQGIYTAETYDKKNITNDVIKIDRNQPLVVDNIKKVQDEKIVADFNVEKKELIEKIDINEETTNEQNKIVFKIQIGAYKQKISDDVEKNFLKLASNTSLDKYRNKNGITIYSVGKFNNYEEALKLKDSIINQGISDAFITPYKGNQRITIRDARRLLNQ